MLAFFENCLIKFEIPSGPKPSIILRSKNFHKNIPNFFDGLIIDRFGPDGISQLIKNFSIRAVKFQSGFIYQYAFVILIGFSILLTLLILN